MGVEGISSLSISHEPRLLTVNYSTILPTGHGHAQCTESCFSGSHKPSHWLTMAHMPSSSVKQTPLNFNQSIRHPSLYKCVPQFVTVFGHRWVNFIHSLTKKSQGCIKWAIIVLIPTVFVVLATQYHAVLTIPLQTWRTWKQTSSSYCSS